MSSEATNTSGSEYAIEVNGLGKCYQIYDKPSDRLKQMLMRGRKQYYKEFWALKDVSFKIKKGETVGIIGRNGSGKSTLLQMICGTLNPTAGEVKVNGRVAALLELGAGFNSEFTGRENVMLNAEILGFPRSEMLERMDDVLAFSELGDFIDQPVKTYSSGMYSRLAFSIAIHVDPDILIVDEALSVGDARFVAKCMRRIKDIQEKGATILFVSHDVGTVRTLCEHAVWLDKGRLVKQGDVFPVTGRYMEYIFRDEKTEHKVPHDELRSEPQVLLPETGTVPQLEPVAIVSSRPARLPNTTSTLISDEFSPSLDSRPVTHWGSHKGIILSASMRDSSGVEKDVFGWGEAVSVVIEVLVPKEISRDYLSIAFSIKNLKGTDLIVSTTHDSGCVSLPAAERFSISFGFINPLVTDKYLLVAAVENRQHSDIHYYEYVEGAHYFASLASERFFGLFHPRIQQQVRTQ